MSTAAQDEGGGLQRVLVATWFYDEQPGFLDFRYRVEALQRAFDVTLVLRDERFGREFEQASSRVRVLHQAAAGTRSLLRFIWQLRALVRDEQPDLVVLLGSQMAIARLLIPARVPVAIYWNEHPTHTFHGGGWALLSRVVSRGLVTLSFASARRAELVMPIGEAHRDELLVRGVAPHRCRMLYMGVDKRFSDRSRGGRSDCPELSLVYTGTVAPERGRDVMLDGLALALGRGIACHLTIVGADEAQRRACESKAAALGIGGAVRVIGRVPGDQVPEFLSRADAGICAWEDRVWWRYNPPTKLFEYLVAGLPVLASRIRTHTLYIDDGRNGIIFDYGPEGFAEAIARLYAMRGRLPSLSAAARELGGTYRWERIEPEFLREIAVAIEKGGAGR